MFLYFPFFLILCFPSLPPSCQFLLPPPTSITLHNPLISNPFFFHSQLCTGGLTFPKSTVRCLYCLSGIYRGQSILSPPLTLFLVSSFSQSLPPDSPSRCCIIWLWIFSFIVNVFYFLRFLILVLVGYDCSWWFPASYSSSHSFSSCFFSFLILKALPLLLSFL